MNVVLSATLHSSFWWFWGFYLSAGVTGHSYFNLSPKQICSANKKCEDISFLEPFYFVTFFCQDQGLDILKALILTIFFLRGTPALHLNEPAGGSCCDVGLGFVWHCYCIYMTFDCLIQKKIYSFTIFEGPRRCRIQKYD